MQRSTLDEVAALIGFRDEDRARLAALAPHAASALPAIAEAFLDVVGRQANRLLHVEDVQRCLAHGLAGPWDAELFQACKRIGRRHAELGVPPYLVVAAINGVRISYRQVASRAFPGDREAYAISIDNLLDVELSIMLHAYHRHRDEQLASMQTLTSGLAHELRNPINSAKLQLEVLSRRLRRHGDDATLREPSERIRDELDRLDSLLDDFLDYAQPVHLHLQAEDLVALVAEVVATELPLATQKQVALAFVDRPARLLAEVDRAKLARVIGNLVRNAIQAVAEGGAVQVRLADDAAILISVIDDGPGIPDDVQKRIFEPFFSTHSGTGLGMAIVQSFVAMHEGTIDIATSPSGTRVDVALPSERRVRGLHDPRA